MQQEVDAIQNIDKDGENIELNKTKSHMTKHKLNRLISTCENLQRRTI